MKNTLGDLNNHLFAQLEKLGDDDLTGEELESELKRTDAICDISEQIIKKRRTAVQGNEAHGRVRVRKTEGGSGNARSSCRGGANHK